MEILSFESLPKAAIEKIFKNLTFSEIVNLKLVNKWFNITCGTILNTAFEDTKDAINLLIEKIVMEVNNYKFDNDLEACSKELALIFLCFKMYQIVKCELECLNVICGRYIQHGVYCFTGGKILDCCKELINVYKIKNAERYFQSYSNLVMRLFLLSELYINYFEIAIEPVILKNYVNSFGTKLIDLLDLYMCSNYHIEATYNGLTCQISARYEIVLTDLVTAPPNLKMDKNSLAKESDLPTLIKYFRNQVRWNNFLYCINLSFCSESLKKEIRKINNLCLNSRNCFESKPDKKFVFDETFHKWCSSSSENENVSYTVELTCSPYYAPIRLIPYLMKAVNEGDQRIMLLSNSSFTNVLEHVSEHYDFNLILKVVLSTSNHVSVESSIDLYHDAANCLLSQHSRKLPS